MKKIIFLLFLTTYITQVVSIATLETALEYQKSEQFDNAIACYEEIICNNPSELNAYFNLGCCHLNIGDKEKAIALFSHILEIHPHALPALYNLGYTYKTFGDLDKAIETYKKVLQIDPNYDAAHLGLGFAYITQGDFELGWQQHSRYLKQSGKNGDKLREFLKNDKIAYKKILLRPEGGLGDTINFVRYADRLKHMGADIILVCQKSLVPLLSRCTHIDQIIPLGNPLPSYDADATLMSLPAIFEDNDQTIPQTIPYIFADPALIKHWQQTLAHDTNFKVGICWQVDVHNDQSKLLIARRGYPLQAFETLADLPNVSFYSVQKCDGLEQLANISPQFKLHSFENLDDQAGPFMDTAALMKNLDLIITVDTAVAHLAGALGCKVWLLHPYATADWRWIHPHTDSYWYPTMRIFKQHQPFGYEEVLEEVKTELVKLIQ